MALNFANNNSLSAITTLPASISGGGMTLISEQTASSSSTISFTSGIDSTYKEYIFKFINIHLSADNGNFSFQGSINSGSSYGVSATTTYFSATHGEAGASGTLGYTGASFDLANGTGFQRIMRDEGTAVDENGCGELTIFDPSSTTFVKHFIARCSNNTSETETREMDGFTAGYFNTTSPINAIQFKCDSGNIDSGVIKLYGVS